MCKEITFSIITIIIEVATRTEKYLNFIRGSSKSLYFISFKDMIENRITSDKLILQQLFTRFQAKEPKSKTPPDFILGIYRLKYK